MKTLKGVIAASTFTEYETPLNDSNLFIEPWYFVLSSKPYDEVIRDAVEGNIAFPEATLLSKIKKAIYPPDTVSASLSFPMARLRPAIWEYTHKDAYTAEVSFPQATLRAPLVETEFSNTTEVNIEFPVATLRHALIKNEYTPDATEASIYFLEASLHEPN